MAYYNNGINVSIRQFLDAFDLCLQKDKESKDGRRDGTRGIYPKKQRNRENSEKVGTFHINFLYNNDGDKYSTSGYLYAKVAGGTLTAKIDMEEIGDSFFNVISFTFSNSKGKKIEGTLVITQDRMGKYYGGAKIECIKDAEHAKLLLNHENILFGAEIKKTGNCEKISFDFSSPIGNSIIHEIGEFGTLDNIENSPIYRRIEMTGIGNKKEPIILEKTKNLSGESKQSDLIELEQPILDGRNDLSKKMIYAGRKLYEHDSEMGDTIRKVVLESFKVGDIPVIKNLASICYMGYEQRGIDALLGISSNTPFYLRNGDDSTDSYRGRKRGKR